MRAILLTVVAGLALAMVGCEKPQFKVVAQLPQPVFGDEAPPGPNGSGDSNFIVPPPPPPQQVRPPEQPRQEQPARGRAFDPAWERHAADNGWRYIIVHHSASSSGNAAVFDKEHRGRGWDELGYHFVIGNGNGSGDGQVEVGPRWVKQKHGAHTKTNDERYNDYGIGICLVGNLENTRATAAQMASLQRLVSYLADRYHIPVNNILGHGEAVAMAKEGRGTKCPGRNFNMDAFRATIRRLAANW